MLHDELVELSEIRDINFALANALFTFSQSAGQWPDAEYDDKEQCTGDSCRGKVACITSGRQCGKNLLPENRDGRRCSEHQCELLPYDEASCADRQHEQRCEATIHPAACIGQQRERGDIDTDVDE